MQLAAVFGDGIGIDQLNNICINISSNSLENFGYYFGHILEVMWR